MSLLECIFKKVKSLQERVVPYLKEVLAWEKFSLKKTNERLEQWADDKQLSNSYAFSHLLKLTLGIFILLFLLGIFSGEWDDSEFWKGVLVEAHGMFFDVVVLGLLLTWLNTRTEKKQLLQRYNEEIEDFRLWKSEEACYRIAGNIRRINKLGESPKNLINLHLVKAYLAGGNFYNSCLRGTDFTEAYLARANFSKANLEFVRFHKTNLEDVDFSDAQLCETEFRFTDLTSAKGLTIEKLKYAHFRDVTFPDYIDKNQLEDRINDDLVTMI